MCRCNLRPHTLYLSVVVPRGIIMELGHELGRGLLPRDHHQNTASCSALTVFWKVPTISEFPDTHLSLFMVRMLTGQRCEIFGLWLLSFCQNERSWPKSLLIILYFFFGQLLSHTCQKFKNIQRAIYIPNFGLK